MQYYGDLSVMFVCSVVIASTHRQGFGACRFFILLHEMVPISLYMSLEVVKLMQCLFIDWDLHMYYPESNRPALARTTGLLEELGQVRYDFRDLALLKFEDIEMQGQSFVTFQCFQSDNLLTIFLCRWSMFWPTKQVP